MIPGPKALLAALALLTFSAACSWSQPPRIQDAILPPMAVQDPLFKRGTGKIYLLPQGLWTLTLDEDDHALTNLKPGELIAFNTLDDASLNSPSQRHIFAIVTKRSWGFLLQRLDDQPITRKAEGSLSPILNLNNDDNICSGTASKITDQATNHCLTQNPLARFDIYAITSETSDDKITTTRRLQIQNEPDSNTLGMPVVRQAQIYVDGQNTPKIFAPSPDLPERWIAIRSTQPAMTPEHISIVSDQDCPDLENATPILNGLTLHHLRLNEKLPNATHPLHVEAAAFEHGADALIWCSNDTTSVATPAIHHPLSTARTQYTLGSSLLGLQPIQISTDPTQRALLAQISALTARNHPELADFVLETLLQTLSSGPPTIQQLAVQSMQLTASAGRPEAALRQGWIATQNTWNREGDPLYILGQAAAFAAFDLNAEYSKRIQQFSKTLQNANDANLVAWLVYDDFRKQIATGNQISLIHFEEIEKNLVARKLDTWAIALRALALQHEIQNHNTIKPAAIEILQKAFHDRKMAPIWTAYIPQNTTIPLNCPDSQTTCQLDSFGRRLATIRSQNTENLITQLRTSPRVDLRSNFRLEQLNIPELNDDPVLQARLILAVFPLLSAPEKTEILPQLAQSLAKTIELSDPTTHPETCKNLVEIQTLGRELALRATAPDNEPAELTAARNAAWLTNEAFPAACHSIAQFEQTVREYTRHSTAQASLITPFFDSLLLHNIDSQNDNTDVARKLAQLTSEIGNNEACLRFNLALAAALARSGQLEDAQKHLLLSGKCAKTDSPNYTQSYNLILNYISYERSGKWPNNQSPQQATQTQNNQCAPLEDGSFNIFHHLDPKIARLAVHFQLPAPKPSAEFLQVRLASSTIAQGEASYQVARRTLSEGRPHQAARLLNDARADFSSSSHITGIARINFLEKILFNQNLNAFIQTDKASSPATRAPKAISQDLSKIPASQLSDIFRHGLARTWLEKFDTTAATQQKQIPAHFIIAASMLVEEPDRTLFRLQSLPDEAMTQPLADFCAPHKSQALLQ